MKGEIVGGNKVRIPRIYRLNISAPLTCAWKACINNAGFNIHSAIHHERPDVNAICHFHSIHGKAWSTFGLPLEMLNQDACTLYRDHAIYNMFGGIVFEASEGVRIAKTLGNMRCIILQNHGLLTTGQTIDELAFLFTLMENTCRVQLLAEAAAANGISKKCCPNAEAEYTYQATSPEAMWFEFQPDYEYELVMTNGEFLE